MNYLGYLIEPNVSTSNRITTTGLTLQRSNSLTSIVSATVVDDSNLNNKNEINNEEYLRICLSCRQVLQKRYDQIRFKNTDKDEVFLHYQVNEFFIFNIYLLRLILRKLLMHK